MNTPTKSFPTNSPSKIAALGAALLLTLAACGDGNDDGGASDTPAAAAVTAAPSGDAVAGGAAIGIDDFSFSGVTEIPVGTTVTVTNNDSASHTWTSADGVFDSGALAPGDSFQITFDAPGTFAYACSFHGSMTGTITVTA